MEYIVQEEQKVKKLSKDEKTQIAKEIYERFQTYDRGRASQLEKANRLKAEVYFKNVAKKEEKKEKQWKSTAKMCKLFMYSQILKAFIWKNTYANTNSMFDVSGDDMEADTNSNKEKTMLVDCLERMEFSRTLDKIIDDSLVYGELIGYSTWKKKTEQYRRPIDFFSGENKPSDVAKMVMAKAKGKNFFVDERVVFDNPYTYSVDPANFVFDSTQFDDWDNCPKILRTWKTPNYIINNKYFEVPKEVANDLRDLVKYGSDESDVGNQDPESLKDEIVNGTTVEVLEHYGDLTLKDGTVLKNWYAVVVAGKYLVRFEENPIVINPFTFGAYVLDPDTKRGISPLYAIYDLATTQEDMLRRTMDLQALDENKPVFAAKGFFKETQNIDLNPGKVIEYDPQMYANVPITPFEFNTDVFTNSLGYIDDLMSEISGIFPNMAGASESERTTATEISTKVEGQLTRLKMLLDIICQNLILPTVKNIAKLKANFTFGEETIFINNENQPEDVVVDDSVRQGEYRFTYADRSATSERFNYADMLAQGIQMFVKAGLQANIEEVFKWYLEQKGVENPERFLMNLNVIDPQVQQALLQDPTLAPIIQQMQQAVEMAKQGKMPPQESQEALGEPQQEVQTEAPAGGLPEQEFIDKMSRLKGRHLLNA